jgi:hypothetical protein
MCPVDQVPTSRAPVGAWSEALTEEPTWPLLVVRKPDCRSALDMCASKGGYRGEMIANFIEDSLGWEASIWIFLFMGLCWTVWKHSDDIKNDKLGFFYFLIGVPFYGVVIAVCLSIGVSVIDFFIENF